MRAVDVGDAAGAERQDELDRMFGPGRARVSRRRKQHRQGRRQRQERGAASQLESRVGHREILPYFHVFSRSIETI